MDLCLHTSQLLVGALIVAAYMSIEAVGGQANFFAYIGGLEVSAMSEQLFRAGRFFDPQPTAAPTNMAWPGMMVLSALIAAAGLALAPFMLMTGFNARRRQLHAHGQFFAMALVGGLTLLTLALIIAHLPRLAAALPMTEQLQQLAIDPVDTTGREVSVIIALLRQLPLATPLFTGALVAAFLAALFVSAASALAATGAMLGGDLFFKGGDKNPARKKSAPLLMALPVLAALALALPGVPFPNNSLPSDPLPLFLLAGAYGLQLLPAMIGLCHAPTLTRAPVIAGLLAGLVAVTAASLPLQSMAASLGLSPPFGAWPLSLHPAFWGLAANGLALFIVRFLAQIFDHNIERQINSLNHQRRFHQPPDGAAVMAPQAQRWRRIALVLAALFVALIVAPLAGAGDLLRFASPLPALWLWQVLAWLIGLPLVYTLAYRLQPDVEPTDADNNGNGAQRSKWRYRIKAPSRKLNAETTGTALVPLNKQQDSE